MYITKPTIKMWAEDDRPREKMLLKGHKALSDSELIAILIGSGTRQKSAVELAQELLEKANNNLSDFARKSIKELQQIKGIGVAKAITIAAALELGRRRKEVAEIKKMKITGAKNVYDLLQPYFQDAVVELFYLVLLNRNNLVLEVICISQGGMASTVVDGKIVFKRAIEASAQALILAHNHPSGNTSPSEADKRLTKKLVEFGNMIDLPVLDHVIYTENGFYSFADNGMI